MVLLLSLHCIFPITRKSLKIKVYQSPKPNLSPLIFQPTMHAAQSAYFQRNPMENNGICITSCMHLKLGGTYSDFLAAILKNGR